MLYRVQNVVVIGGGVLGLEAAWELKKSRKQVVVLEAAPQIMGRQLDEGASQMLTDISRSNGGRFRYFQGIDIGDSEHLQL